MSAPLLEGTGIYSISTNSGEPFKSVRAIEMPSGVYIHPLGGMGRAAWVSLAFALRSLAATALDVEDVKLGGVWGLRNPKKNKVLLVTHPFVDDSQLDGMPDHVREAVELVGEPDWQLTSYFQLAREPQQALGWIRT